MTNVYDNLSLSVRQNPGNSGLLDLGVTIEGGFLPLTSVTTGRLAKVVARGQAEAAEAAAAAPAAPAAG